MKLISLTNATDYLSNSTSLYDITSELNTPPRSIPQCSGTIYGTDLERFSCFDAWRNMGLTPGRVAWGPRGRLERFQYTLPARWSSGRVASRH